MSEPSKSQSSKKAAPEEQPVDQERELSELQGGAGASGEQGSNLLSDFEPETDGEEFTEEYPDWLLNLESKSVDISLETGFPGSEKTGESSSPAGDIQPEDLPDWLLENYTPTPQADKEKAIEYEIPEWLQTGLDELSASEGDSEQLPASAGQPPEVGLPEDEAAFMVTEPASEPDEPAASSPREPGDLETLLSLMDADNQSIVTLPGDEQIFLSGAEEADENFIEGIPPAPPADQSIENLAEVRNSLKDEEQAKPKKERPGFVERLTGWMVVSSHGQGQRIEQRLEGQMDQADTQASGTGGSEQTPGAEPKSPAEPLSSRQGEDLGVLPGAVAGAVLFGAAGLDEFDEIELEPSATEEGSVESADSAAELFEGELSSDQEGIAEPLPQDETSTSGPGSGIAEEGKEKKGFLGGLFGMKKAEQPEETAISDEEVERRLLIALGAASLEESPATAPVEPAQEAEETITPVQEEETDFLDWDDTEYEDVESVLFKGQETYAAEIEETAEQPVEEAPDVTEAPATPGKETQETTSGDSFMELREVALQDYVESPEPPAPGPVSKALNDAVQEIMGFSLGKKLALAALIIINLGLVAILGVIFLFNFLQLQVDVTPAPVEPTPLPALQGPFPVAVTLPGGWSFDLNQGTLRDGLWLNEGAEWLRGTEITRWVALPWSEQLEAVVVTLGPEDRIELTLSNQDRLKYKVDAVIEVPVGKVSELNLDRPSLLLILANREAETRVVVTASLAEDE